MKKISSLLAALFLVFPSITSAAVTDFKSLMQLFVNVLGSFIGVLYMAAFVAFFWGIALFILNTDDDAKRAEGKTWMLWSVIALFVMITIWGIVSLLVNTVGIGKVIIPQL
jgi:hypothetical protein